MQNHKHNMNRKEQLQAAIDSINPVYVNWYKRMPWTADEIENAIIAFHTEDFPEYVRPWKHLYTGNELREMKAISIAGRIRDARKLAAEEQQFRKSKEYIYFLFLFFHLFFLNIYLLPQH